MILRSLLGCQNQAIGRPEGASGAVLLNQTLKERCLKTLIPQGIPITTELVQAKMTLCNLESLKQMKACLDILHVH